MNTDHMPDANPRAPRSDSEVEIEQAIERYGAKYTVDLRALSPEFTRRAVVVEGEYDAVGSCTSGLEPQQDAISARMEDGCLPPIDPAASAPQLERRPVLARPPFAVLPREARRQSRHRPVRTLMNTIAGSHRFTGVRRFPTLRPAPHPGSKGSHRGGEGRASVRENFRTFAPFVMPHLWTIVLAGLLVLAGTGTGLLRPWPLKYLFDDVLIPGKNQESVQLYLLGIAGAIVGIAVLDGLLGYLHQYLLNTASQKVAFHLRLALYGQLQRLSLTFHERQQTGELITRVTDDVDEVQELMTENLIEAASDALALVGMLVVMFWLDWQLSVAMMAIIPLLFFAITHFRQRIKQAAKYVRRKEGDITSLAQETLAAIRLVKALGREEFETNRFEAHTGEALHANLRVARTEAAFSSSLGMLTAFSLGGLVWLGAQRVLSGSLTPGDLLIFITYLKDFYGPVRTLTKLSADVSKTSVRAEKIAEVLREEPAVKDLAEAKPAPPLRGHVQFENVGFAYVPGHLVLSGINFQVEPGQVLALVGQTGAGKSTISTLIPRLYEPSEGRVLIDGHDIRNYKLVTLQPQIGLVMQNSVLFHATVRENIAYGRPEATFEEIVAAAKVANAHDFIMALADGYDTIIGERGETVSGGQRQRIAIARTVVRNAPILILDEPTTGLDAKSEQLVLDALDRVMMGRTTIIIAHKLATIRRANTILVIDHGRVVERGSHQELLALDGCYAELFRLQAPD